MKECTNCKKSVDSDALFCPYCGTKLNKAKSKAASVLLALFLGPLGIHNFYLGYKAKAITQLLVTVVTLTSLFLSLFTFDPLIVTMLYFIFIISFLFVYLWAIIEAVLTILDRIKDSDGNELA